MKKAGGYGRERRSYIIQKEQGKEEHSCESSRKIPQSKSRGKERKIVELESKICSQNLKSNSGIWREKDENNLEGIEKSKNVHSKIIAQQTDLPQYKVPTQVRPPLPSHNRKNKGKKRGKQQEVVAKPIIKTQHSTENISISKKLVEIEQKIIEAGPVQVTERVNSNKNKADSKTSSPLI